jgi:RNA polymerase sigma-70 factor (ECF subfamily)
VGVVESSIDVGSADVSDAAPRDVVIGLFDQSAPRLLRYVKAFGVQPDAAEDIVQEVFLALFRHLEHGRSRRNLQGWVFRVAHNLALKHRQRAGRREMTVSERASSMELGIDPSAGPEEQAVEAQRQARVKAAFDALPERERRCLLLRAEGLQYREIAKVIGLSLGTVANTLTRALSRLEEAHER